jgi:D-alanyl-D-alanine carboxypeptidase/D-alanyl-D-alanine-endopeptidase (penicillin-binding protein 4)
VRRLRWIAVVCLAACAPARTPPAAPNRLTFTSVADSLVLTSDLNQTHWGIEVFDPARNRTLYSWNGNRHFIPASNTKLVVTTVAMGLLGPDFRYRTDLFASGAAGDSTVDRLLVVARGDPTWSARFYGNDFAVLEQLADSIARAGVREVRQELVIDASYFGPERVHSAWEVGDLPFAYAAPVAAFAIAEGTISLIVSPGPTHGSLASVRLLNAGSVFNIVSSITTDSARASANVDVDYQSWPHTIALSGATRLQRPDTTDIAAPDANRFAAAAFADALARRGVRVLNVRIVYDSTEAQTLRSSSARSVASWTSVPLAAIVGGILQPSQNWIAEQLVKTLGASQRNRGTWSSGIEVERRYLIDVAKLDSTSFSVRDASGLTAQNLLSPSAIVRLLEHARQSPWGDIYKRALPTPGLPRSTLSNRLSGLEGKVFAKTGTIANVNSLSGYITTTSGRELVFSIMTNASGRSSAQVRRGIDRLIMALAAQRDWE